MGLGTEDILAAYARQVAIPRKAERAVADVAPAGPARGVLRTITHAVLAEPVGLLLRAAVDRRRGAHARQCGRRPGRRAGEPDVAKQLTTGDPRRFQPPLRWRALGQRLRPPPRSNAACPDARTGSSR